MLTTGMNTGINTGGSYSYGNVGGVGMTGVNGAGVHVQGPAGGSMVAGQGGMVHGGVVHGSGGSFVGAPGGVVYPSQGVCDVGSGCCGNGAVVVPGGGVGVDPGFGVTPGIGGGAIGVDPGFGVAPGVGIGPGAGGDACCMGGPDVACGGAGSACCEPAGATVTSTGWSYMGPGRGEFNACTSYNYVGYGAGAYSKELVTTFYGCKPRPCCLALLCLLLLLPLLWLLWPTDGKTESVDPPPQTPIGTCSIFGDPHVVTFDGQHADYYSSGEFFLVKSQKLMIQARYLPTQMTNGLAVTKILAISGDVVQGKKIFVSATSVTVDGQPVLTGFPSTYSIPGCLEMVYNNVGDVLQKGRTGMDLHVVHIKINDGSPEGIQIQVNRWTRPSEGNYINVRITMHAIPGQDGHCGNFNGNAADDDRIQVRSRVGKTGVPPNLLLFHSKTAIVATPNRPNINDCPTDKLQPCEDKCKAVRKTFFPPADCVTDCCFAGAGFVDEE